MADPEVKQQDEEQTDPKKNPNLLDADKDGKISADELKTKLESADARNFTWKTSEGLKAYLEDKPQDKEAFKTMCEKILTDPKNTSLNSTKDKMETAPTRAEVSKDTTLFTSQERGTIALTSLYLWLKGTPKAENYETVRNFLLNGVAKDAQWADLKLDQLVAPEKWWDEVVLGSEKEGERGEKKKSGLGTTNQWAEQTQEGTLSTQEKTNAKTITNEENSNQWQDTNQSNPKNIEKQQLTQEQQEALEKSSQELVEQHRQFTEGIQRLNSKQGIWGRIYENSPLFGEIMITAKEEITNKTNKVYKDIQNDYSKDWEEIKQNLPSICTAGKDIALGRQQIDLSKITDGEWKLNKTGEVVRLQMLASLKIIHESFDSITNELKKNADAIAAAWTPERSLLDDYTQTMEWVIKNARILLTNIWSESGNPAEGAFLQQIEQINKKNFSDQLFSGELPAGSTTITDIYKPQKQFDAFLASNESMSSTFGLPNTLKNAKLDDISWALSKFKQNTIPHEINGEIIYFNKDQLNKQWFLSDTGEIKDESDQLLLDAKASGKVGAWSVSELVNDAHQNKNVIFHPNEDGKDIRELGDDKQQERLEQLAEQPVTEMSEKREEKTFAEQDLAGKLDKKANLSESRLILTDILKQPGLKWTALGMEKPDQSLIKKNDFLKLNVGDETRYISTNDYLDLTQDSRELSNREKNNIDDNQANEAEKTRINYLDLAEQKYNLSAFEDDWKVDTQRSKLTFANKETDQIIGLDMKNTDAPIFSFRLDNKPFSLTTSPDKAKQVFDRIQDLNEKYTSLQEAFKDKDTKSTDQVFQLGFLQDHASDLISGNEMTLDTTTRTGIKDLPTWKKTLTIDNFIYDDATSLLAYSATDQKKKEAAPPPATPSKINKQTTFE